jgi:carbon-monoxide dehydrogenase large subunit
VAIVEVDPDTGSVALLQHVAVDDCGVVINPLLVEGQIHGGVAQALGQALYEEAFYDALGQPIVGSLADYPIPKATMMPPMMTLRTETPSPLNPLGAKGVGEAGTIGATPAVTNAVIDALAPFGVRHLDMPLVPQKIWTALRRPRPA